MAKEDTNKDEESQAATYDTFDEYLRLAIKEYYDRGWKNRRANFIALVIASGQMAVAYWLFHAPASIYPAVNGGDAAILFSFIFLHIAVVGAGAFSLDALLRRKGGESRIGLAAPAASEA